MTAKKRPVRPRQKAERPPKGLTEGQFQAVQSLFQNFNFGNLDELNDLLKTIAGQGIEMMMRGELTEHLGYEKSERSDSDNARNGTKPKKVRSKYGEIPLSVPKDRNGTFEPQIVKNRQKDISGIEDRIIGLFSRGLSTREVADYLGDLYGSEHSESLISRVTEQVRGELADWQERPLEKVYPVLYNVADKIMGEIEDWKVRPLNRIYPILYIDAVHFSVREEGVVQKLAAYVVLGIDMRGYTDVLSIEIGENESAKFWLSVLNNLKNRGVEDVMVICADGLTGIKEAIGAAFPKAEYQRCIVHLQRNSMAFVSYKDRKGLSSDLRSIYLAPSEAAGHQALENATAKWSGKYPHALKRWEDHWEEVCPIFKFSLDVRKIIYTTNAIESLNSGYKKLNSQRRIFPSAGSLLKSLFLATKLITKKWTKPIQNWLLLCNEFTIIYGNRMQL